MQLVIAEKPSVARSIAEVIGAAENHDGYMEGNGYVVSWLPVPIPQLIFSSSQAWPSPYGTTPRDSLP